MALHDGGCGNYYENNQSTSSDCSISDKLSLALDKSTLIKVPYWNMTNLIMIFEIIKLVIGISVLIIILVITSNYMERGKPANHTKQLIEASNINQVEVLRK